MPWTDTGIEPRVKHTDVLNEQEFYELMQQYRHSPITDNTRTVLAFESVKDYIRLNFNPK